MVPKGLEPFAAFEKELGREASEALHVWLKQELRTVRLQRWLEGGSGAKVALVHSEEKDDSRNAVLKLCPAGDKTENEYQKTKAAWQNALPGFRSHLLEPLWGPVAVPGDGSRPGNPWFMFQRLAGGSTRKIVNFSQLPWIEWASAYRAVTRALLETWGSVETKHDITVQDFMTEMLQDRLYSGEPLRVWAEARDTGLLERPEERLSLPDESDPLINPFLFARKNRLGRSVLSQAFMGKAHGDLNLGNVLVPRSTGGYGTFILIDLARYSDSAPLARDPTQLLLYVVRSRLAKPDCVALERTALLRVLTDPDSDPGTMIPFEMKELISEYWQLMPVWAESKVDEWDENRCLSLVACALMFCGREGVSEADRVWFLRLAAHAATYYVTEFKGEGVKNPVESTRAKSAPTVIAETTEARPQSGGNVAYVDFVGRREVRGTAPSAGAAAQAADLAERLIACVDDLRTEVASLSLSLRGQDLRIKATMARYLVDTLSGTAREVDALRLQDGDTDYRGLIGYTEALGALRRQVEATQRQIHLLGAPEGASTDPGRAYRAVEKLRHVTGALRVAVNGLR
ncbi:hypothetical protein [Streptomyces tauricus]